MSKMRDAAMPLCDRIEAAIRRITGGEGTMRVPVEATDPDIVLCDCQIALAEPAQPAAAPSAMAPLAPVGQRAEESMGKQPWEDRADPRNGEAYHTGKPCIEAECDRPAGTAWSKLWCVDCNIERMRRITRSLAELGERHG